MSTTPDAVPAHDDVPAVDAPIPDAATRTDPARRRRLLVLVAALTGLVLVVDQVTKAWAVSALRTGERIDVVGDLLGLTLLYNPGAALSIATGMTWVLTVIAVVVVVVTVRASRRIGSRGWAVALGLLLGGAVGNLVDRFFRDPGPARGHVVDFIAYGDLFVGNVADIAIVGAAGLIMLLALRGIGLDGSREHDAATGRPGPGDGAETVAGAEVRADLPAGVRAEVPADVRTEVPADVRTDVPGDGPRRDRRPGG